MYSIYYLLINIYIALSGDVFPLFSDEQNDILQRQVEEHDFRVGILGDESLAFLEEIGDVDDIRLVDESGEVPGEILLLLCHITEFRLAEIIHETLAQHVHEVIEHSLLLLSAEGGNHLAPLLQVVDVAHIGEAHQHDEHIQMLAVFIARVQLLQSMVPVAVGDSGDAVG